MFKGYVFIPDLDIVLRASIIAILHHKFFLFFALRYIIIVLEVFQLHLLTLPLSVLKECTNVIRLWSSHRFNVKSYFLWNYAIYKTYGLCKAVFSSFIDTLPNAIVLKILHISGNIEFTFHLYKILHHSLSSMGVFVLGHCFALLKLSY